jgi:putative membrane protein
VTYADLPLVNATLNGISACLLTAGYGFIRQKRVTAHRVCMVSALITSVAFLTTYAIYHLHAGSKHFVGPDAIRMAYLALLLSHTVLAAAVPVLALITLSRALKGQLDRHRAIARITLPIWWYVSVTGVLIYVMLYHVSQ